MILKILKTMPKSFITTEIKNQVRKEKGLSGFIKICRGVFEVSPLIYLAAILFVVSIFDIDKFNETIILNSEWFRGFSFFYFVTGFIVLKNIRFISLEMIPLLLFSISGTLVYVIVAIDMLLSNIFIGTLCLTTILLDYHKKKRWLYFG